MRNDENLSQMVKDSFSNKTLYRSMNYQARLVHSSNFRLWADQFQEHPSRNTQSFTKPPIQAIRPVPKAGSPNKNASGKRSTFQDRTSTPKPVPLHHTRHSCSLIQIDWIQQTGPNSFTGTSWVLEKRESFPNPVGTLPNYRL